MTWSQATGSATWTADPGPSGGYQSAVITATPSDDSAPQLAGVPSALYLVATDNDGDLEFWSDLTSSFGTWTQEQVAAAT